MSEWMGFEDYFLHGRKNPFEITDSKCRDID